MLLLKPNCEWCDIDLPPESTEARICSYECTFCAECVHGFLQNVCPNCGGGFSLRPIRPQQAHRTGISINHQPASTERVHSPYGIKEVQSFVAQIASLRATE